MPSDSGAWAPSSGGGGGGGGGGERRLSNSSDGSAGSGYAKPTASESADYLQLRGKVVGGKPAANPLQFVKVGPCELYRSAQEQLQRAEKVKNNKELRKEELEDWQSNLDNWKSARRKRVEHIIERCVEVKRMESEPAPGARAKSKTFNEMLEERAGKRRRCPLALYPEEETTDLSDLGIGTSSTKSSLSEDCDTQSLASDGIDLDKNHSDVDNLSNCGSGNRKLGSSANEYDTCTTTTISSPEPEEYTYEGAIEGYKSRMSSDYKNYSFNKEKTPEKVNGDINRIRTTVSNRIEERVTSLQNKAELKPNQKKDLPKIDIMKRKEQFEKENSPEVKSKVPDMSNKMSIKARLSSFEKITEDKNKSTNDLSKPIAVEVIPLKDRLSSLEKLKATSPETEKPKPRLSNGDLENSKSVRERLSSLKSQTSEESVKIVKTEVKEVSMSIKDRLSSLDAAKNVEIQKQVDLNNDTKEEPKENSLKTSLSGIENNMQNFCRSLDNLNINGSASPSPFERVQSFEELEMSNDNERNCMNAENEVVQNGGHNFESHKNNGNSEKMPDALVEQTNENTIERGDNDDDQENSRADTESTTNYHQAVSHLDDLSAADDITEIQLDNDEDTLKSLDPQDTSVIDALELAFQEIDYDEKDAKKEVKIVSTKVKTTEEKPKNNSDVNATKNIHNGKDSNTVKETKLKEEVNKSAPVYENIDIFYENGGILESVDAASVFPLDLPKKLLEPPKEKPPPPPVEDCVEDDVPLGNGNFKSVNSTRRIKKEIRNKRTSFLGLEGQEDDYLEVSLAPRPDITSFLQEETKIEKLLYKKTLSHDMDSKLRESRDSGVDLDKHSAENYKSSSDTSNPHSRQNSEPFTQMTVTSDEEDSTKKADSKQFNEKLNSKLEEMQDFHPAKVNVELNKIDSLDKTLQQQQEVLRFERELLQLEQEELRRQRDNLLFRESQTRRLQKSVQDLNNVPANPTHVAPPRDHRHSMPDLMLNQDIDFSVYDDQSINRQMMVRHDAQKRYDQQMNERNSRYDQRMDAPQMRHHSGDRYANERSHSNGVESSPKRQSREGPYVRPAAPKPRSNDSVEREMMMRSSRVPSADHANIEKPTQPRPKPIVNGVVPGTNGQYHPMTRNTLQALSAAPTPKLISGADWLQPGSRRQIPPSFDYNKHWLIQEAEQRRIEEQRSRMRLQPNNNQRHLELATNSPRHHDLVPNSSPRHHDMATNGPRHHDVLTPNSPRHHDMTPNSPRHHEKTPNSPRHHEMAANNSPKHHEMATNSPRHYELAANGPRHHEINTHNAAYKPHQMHNSSPQGGAPAPAPSPAAPRDQDGETLLSVSGKRKCSHCGQELGRGAAMIIESLSLCYHVSCFACVVCGARLGDGRAGADVRVRARRLHCHACYSSDDGTKLSCV